MLSRVFKKTGLDLELINTIPYKRIPTILHQLLVIIIIEKDQLNFIRKQHHIFVALFTNQSELYRHLLHVDFLKVDNKIPTVLSDYQEF